MSDPVAGGPTPDLAEAPPGGFPTGSDGATPAATAAPPPRRRRARGRRALAAAALALAAVAVADWAAWRRHQARLFAALDPETAAATPAAVLGAARAEADPARARIALARVLVAHELTLLRERVGAATEPGGTPDGAPSGGAERGDATEGHADAGAGAASGDAASGGGLTSPTEPSAAPGAALDRRLARLERARGLAAGALAARPAAWQAPMLIGAATYLARSAARDPRLVTAAPEWEAPLAAARRLAPGKDEPGRLLVVAYLELWRFLSPGKRELTRDLLRRALADPETFLALIDPWLAVAEGRREAFAALPADPFVWGQMLHRYAAAADWRGYLEALPHARAAGAGRRAAQLDEADARRRGGDLGISRALYFEAAGRAEPSLGELPALRRALDETPPGPPPEQVRRDFRRWLEWALELCGVGRCPLDGAPFERLLGFAAAGPTADPDASARLLAGARARADARRAAPARRTWPAADWAWENGRGRLALHAAAPGRLAVRIDGAPAAGAVVALRIDGRDAGAFAARPGAWLEPALEIDPGLHLLEQATLAGRPVRPGEVLLEPVSGP